MSKVQGSFKDFVSFSRASGGTYLDANGVLQTASDNIPRVEYDASGNVKGLLIEEARTNLVTFSEDFTGSGWAVSNGTKTTGVNDPFGGTTAMTLTATSANGQVLRSIGGSAGTGTNYTGSFYIRRRTGSGVVSLFNPNGGGITAITITSEWQRYSVTGAGAAATNFVGVRLNTSGDEVDIAYGQLEAGSFATSYIPTSGATATRSADICSIDVDQFGYNYTNTVGTFFADFESFSTVQIASRAMTAVLGTDRAVDINMAFETLRADVYSNHTGGDLYGLNNASAGRNKIAAAMTENNSAACANGGTVDVDTATGTPIVASKLEIGRYYTTGYLNGHIKSIKYYPRRLTNAQLQELTS